MKRGPYRKYLKNETTIPKQTFHDKKKQQNVTKSVQNSEEDEIELVKLSPVLSQNSSYTEVDLPP